MDKGTNRESSQLNLLKYPGMIIRVPQNNLFMAILAVLLVVSTPILPSVFWFSILRVTSALVRIGPG